MSKMANRCDEDVFKNGFSIAVIDACMYRAEQWVQAVAKESGQKVDWHYSGGRANVLYLGDHDKVLKAVNKLTPELEQSLAKDPETMCRCTGPLHGRCQVLMTYPRSAHGPYRDGDLG